MPAADEREPLLNPENGHYYATVSCFQGFTWFEADAVANTMEYAGMQGHLATITDQSENDFLFANVLSNEPNTYYWLGGFQTDFSAEPTGHWQWVTGEPFIYTMWAPGEPNNFPGPTANHEDGLHIIGLNGTWNDLHRNRGTLETEGVAYHFVIEFEGGTAELPEPIAYWPANGDALDLSGNDHHGQILGALNFSQGVAEEAFDLNGLDSRVRVDGSILDVREPYTISAWILLRSEPTWPYYNYSILSKDQRPFADAQIPSIVDMGFFVSSSGGGRKLGLCHAPPGGTCSVYSEAAIPVGEFTHVAITYDGESEARFYINGNLDSAPWVVDGGNSASIWNIGAGNHPEEFFDGLIDEVALFDVALTEAQVHQLYLGGLPPINSPQLLVEWELDQHPSASTPLPGTVQAIASAALEADDLFLAGASAVDNPCNGDYYANLWPQGNPNPNAYFEFGYHAQPGFAVSPTRLTYALYTRFTSFQIGPQRFDLHASVDGFEHSNVYLATHVLGSIYNTQVIFEIEDFSALGSGPFDELTFRLYGYATGQSARRGGLSNTECNVEDGQPIAGTGSNILLEGTILDVATPARIEGIVFRDDNLSSSLDSGEIGLEDMAVFLDLNENGIPDPGEPYVATSASGDYTFTGLSSGRYVVKHDLLLGYAQTSPAPTQNSRLLFEQVLKNGQLDEAGTLLDRLDFPRWGTASSDGRHVYVVNYNSDAINAFARDPDTGHLTLIERLVDGQPDMAGHVVNGLNGAWSVGLSPNGEHLYVAGLDDHSVTLFNRESGSGRLTWVETLVDGGTDWLGNPVNVLARCDSVTVSSDARHVYTTSDSNNGVTVFQRDLVTGRLTFVQELQDGGTDGAGNTIDGLASSQWTVLSPDGLFAYVVGHQDSAVAVFERDPDSGRLTYIEKVQDGGQDHQGNQIDGLDHIVYLTLSPSGDHLYAAGHLDHAISIFARNVATGRLTFVGMVQKGQPDPAGTLVDGLQIVGSLVFTSDGQFLYASGQHDSAVAVFRHSPVTGQLYFVEFLQDGGPDSTGQVIDGLNHAKFVVMSPDDRHLYVLGEVDDAVAVFTRTTTSYSQGVHVVDLAESQVASQVNFGIILLDQDGDGLTDFDESNVFFTDPANPDTDQDALDDGFEVSLGTNPLQPDTDNDGLEDGFEVTEAAGTSCPNPLLPDSDGDGLGDGEEIAHGTLPCDPDSDDDAVPDGEEVYQYLTDPLSADTDLDGLMDGTEIEIAGQTGCPNPLVADSDGDTISDGNEVALGCDPCNPDTTSVRILVPQHQLVRK